MCFGCSKELSHRDGSFEYPQHMFLLRNKKNYFQLRTHIWGPEYPARDLLSFALYLLQLVCPKMGTLIGLDFILPKMAFHHHK